MENANRKKTRRRRRRKRNTRKAYFMLFIKLAFCVVAISATLAAYYGKRNTQVETPVTNVQVNPDIKQEITNDNKQIESNGDNKDSNQNNGSEPKKDEIVANITSNINDKRFEGIHLVNDNRGVPVICYHSVSENNSKRGPIVIPKDIFREQLKTIKDNGYTTLTMAELKNYLFKNEPIPEKSVVVTFDDGYADNYVNAFPILKEFNMKATIFIISSYIDRELYLSASQIKEMSDYGIDIESHTVSHKRLSTFSYDDQYKELKDSKDAIEQLTHKQVVSVAYPEGIYNNDTKKAVVDAGYAMGFTIERGYADRNDNLAQVNRICLDYTFKPYSILNVLKNLKK